MAGEAAREPRFDPRFDPRFQRGYEPPTDSARPAPDAAAPVAPIIAAQAEQDPGAGPGAAARSAPDAAVEDEPAAGAPDAQAAPAAAPDPTAGALGRAGADRARPWLIAAWIVAAGVIATGSVLVGIAVTSVRVIQPTGTIDQAVMVQVTSFSIAPSLIEIGVIGLVVLIAVSGVRRARTAPRQAGTARAVAGALRDPSVIVLAIIAAVGVAIATWSAGWQPEPAGSVTYFGQPTYDDLWPVRLDYLASTVAGAATIAAVGGCIGALVVIGARLRAH
jgi:hypothetical protein